MTETGKKALLGAAVAGIIGAALAASPVSAKSNKAAANVKCWGVNKCGGHAHSCMGKGSCAGKNSCKGQGWLAMPKDSCESIEGGSLTPPKKADAQPMKDMGSH
ncbi:MAG: hypothetical protein KGR26_15470 [Cyanobacteria bacterium REEB65]|nr:hypothetical protein [Cyanobacteria bacterium REEB65]